MPQPGDRQLTNQNQRDTRAVQSNSALDSQLGPTQHNKGKFVGQKKTDSCVTHCSQALIDSEMATIGTPIVPFPTNTTHDFPSPAPNVRSKMRPNENLLCL